MNTRERILEAFAHHQPDRCPTFIWLEDEAIQPLADHLQVSAWFDLEQKLKIDRWRFADLDIDKPSDYAGRLGAFIPDEFLERDDVIISPDDGRVLRVPDPDEPIQEEVLWSPLEGITSLADFAEYPFPDLMGLVIPDDFTEYVRQRQIRDAVVWGSAVQPFTFACQLRGLGNFLSDLMIRPEIVDFIYERSYRFITMKAEALAEANVDVIQLVGDIALPDRLMMAPDLWRRFDKPKLEALILVLREIKPDICIGLQSNGKLTDIIPDLLSIGIDFLSPVQPEAMDPCALKRQWGKRLLLQGGVGQRLLAQGTPDEVRAEARRLIAECGRDGGFILGPSLPVKADFPMANLQAMYEAVE